MGKVDILEAGEHRANSGLSIAPRPMDSGPSGKLLWTLNISCVTA